MYTFFRCSCSSAAFRRIALACFRSPNCTFFEPVGSHKMFSGADSQLNAPDSTWTAGWDSDTLVCCTARPAIVNSVSSH